MIIWNDNDELVINNINDPYKINSMNWTLPDDVEIKTEKTDENTNQTTIILKNASKHIAKQKFETVGEIKHGKWDLREYYPLIEIENNTQYLSTFVITLHKDNWLLTINISYKGD